MSRRQALAGAFSCVAALAVPARAIAASDATRRVPPLLMARAMAALQQHGRMLKRDLIAIADFDRPSSQPRFHLIDLQDGRTTSLLVAHGRGSDPGHSGWLKRFSNAEGSEASSSGAYATGSRYIGKHGPSAKLTGLDRSNSNAASRAIVVHPAWYANRDMIAAHGKLGRSEGCFAVSEDQLQQVLQRLGRGRMIYAGKLDTA